MACVCFFLYMAMYFFKMARGLTDYLSNTLRAVKCWCRWWFLRLGSAWSTIGFTVILNYKYQKKEKKFPTNSQESCCAKLVKIFSICVPSFRFPGGTSFNLQNKFNTGGKWLLRPLNSALKCKVEAWEWRSVFLIMVWDVPPSRAQAVTLNYPPAAAPIHRCTRCNNFLTFLSWVYPESPAGGQSVTAVCHRAACQKYLPDKLELDGGSLIWL